MRPTLLFSALQSREQGKVAPADNKLQQEPFEVPFYPFAGGYVVTPWSATLRLMMPMQKHFCGVLRRGRFTLLR